MSNLLSLTSSETPEQGQILDDALYSLTTEWKLEQSKVFGKRQQLLVLLNEVGKARFQQAVQRTVETYGRDLIFPSTSYIRAQVSTLPVESPAHHGRRHEREENFGFGMLLAEINYLQSRAQSCPEDRERALFQRSRRVGVLHWWLKQHPDCISKLPEHLEWVTDLGAVGRYVAECPAPLRRIHAKPSKTEKPVHLLFEGDGVA